MRSHSVSDDHPAHDAANASASASNATASPPVPHLSPSTAQRLRTLLQQSGYAAAQELIPAAGMVRPANPPFALHSLRRLFARGESVSAMDAAEALAPLTLDELVEAGLLARQEGSVRARFQIQVYSGLLFIVDFMPRDHAFDVVLPIGPSGRYLASLTVRESISGALDIGCGCGIQSLLMSRHARQVTATDINPRALALTQLNAELNGATNIEVVLGSYFEPVRGQRFDLIVANLPYVITPETRYIYRDLGRGDDLTIRHNVEQMPEHLNENGYAQIMLNWIHREEQPWWEPLESWTTRRNVDAWLMFSNSMTPGQYSRQWIGIDEREKPAAYAAATKSWLEWYRRQKIERIAFGVLSLRRRTATDNWRCSIAVSKTASEPLGEHILHLFRSEDYLQGMQPKDLLGRALQPWNAVIEPASGNRYIMRSLAGFGLQYSIGRETARTISHLDGRTLLCDAIEAAEAAEQQISEIIEEIYQLMNIGLIEGVE